MNFLCATVTVCLAVVLVSDVVVASPDEKCDLPLDDGAEAGCRGAHQRWAYADGACTKFLYGGCGGNTNNFQSEEECQRQCVCTQPLYTGNCRGGHRRWGYSDGECTQFLYGGCGSNGNNFMNEEDCEATCQE